MALRTFRSNPSLGGFGGESSNPTRSILNNNKKKGGSKTKNDGDAFAQIVKELVDNAVDACSAAVDKQTKKRVRVTIERFEEERDNENEEEDDDDDEQELDTDEILRVTVSDNGCGMESIQACVDPFHTSKAHHHHHQSSEKNDDDSTSSSLGSEGRTAGRYGIGLTLCLLHAQRLVPDSCASIKSATADQHHWTLVSCVVDADGDSIRCIREERLTKAFEEESGTSVSVLVPGGATATLVWPRLAEYFARFKLSLGLKCSLEVLAPTLSKVPLLVRPAKEKAASRNTNSDTEQDSNDEDEDEDDEDSCDSRALYKGFDDDESEQQESRRPSAINTKKKNKEDDHIKDRMGIWRAVQLYLERPVELKNIAHALVPIRFDNNSVDRANRPKLEVDMIVRGSDDQTDSDDGSSVESEMSSDEEDASGKLVLIRMVNRIPLLDSAEAVACGLVQGLAAKKRVWHSFGLDVTLQHDIADIMKLPTFQVRDSEQVAPFFQKRSHELFREHEEEEDVSDVDSEDNSDSESMDDETQQSGVKRKRKKKRSLLLPAKVRLANILMIVQIHANPTTLPLPTLSKGRLPIDNTAIDAALEVGLGECLRQLQKTNPSLLLSANELRKAERDARYVPAVASALASILCKSTSPDQDILDKIRQWSTSDATSSQDTEESSLQDDDADVDSNDKSHSEKNRAKEIGSNIESRLRSILSQKKRPNKRDTKGGAGNESSEEEESSRKSVSNKYDDDLLERSSKEGETEDESSRGSLSRSGDEDPKASQSTGDDDYDDWL